MHTQKPTIAVVFGSRSTEHDISILTAVASVIKPLQLSQKYNVVPVYITKDGRWFSDPRLGEISLYQSGALETFLAKKKPVSLLFKNGLILIENSGLRQKEIKIDAVFPATHGTHGEDGELMALCEMANVPYVGCDVRASVVAMDKVLAKQVAQANGIATPSFVAFYKHEYEADKLYWHEQIASLRYPLFVKPAHLGSSIGISRVTTQAELANAIEVALHYDDKALVEEGVPNLIEVTLPIIGNHELVPAYLEQPTVSAEDFFDFDTKYLKGGKGKGAKNGENSSQGYSTIPADLPKHLYDKAEQLGLATFRALGCEGYARIDMLIDAKTEAVYFNEANPLPGSLYTHNWAKKGISNVELAVRLINLAYERFERQKTLTTGFSTNYLQQF